jgi:hypothetical protein
MCECVLCTIQDSHIFRRVGATYQATENVSQENPYTPFEETVAQILQVEYNVVLKKVRKNRNVSIHSSLQVQYNEPSLLWYCLSFHTEERGPVPVLTSIEDSVKSTISVGYSDVEMLHCCQGGADEKHVMLSTSTRNVYHIRSTHSVVSIYKTIRRSQ